MSPPEEPPIYDLLGEEKIASIVAGFYRRVPEDPILGPMYPERDYAGAERRLRMFLIQRFGGPATYSAERGPPRLRRRHHPFAVDRTARDRWCELMTASIREHEIEEDVRLWFEGFLGDVATFLINRD